MEPLFKPGAETARLVFVEFGQIEVMKGQGIGQDQISMGVAKLEAFLDPVRGC